MFSMIIPKPLYGKCKNMYTFTRQFQKLVNRAYLYYQKYLPLTI